MQDVLPSLDVACIICPQVSMCSHHARPDASHHSVSNCFLSWASSLYPLHHCVYCCYCGSLL